jgi:signal transduction histidine kinase
MPLPRPRRTPLSSEGRVRASLQRAADEERRRLARTLHDSALQTLTAASMNFSLVERESGALSAQGRQALADGQALLEDCGRELRALSNELFPALLGTAGLSPALRWLAGKHGPERVRLELATLPRYGASVELAAYRLVEEAVASFYADQGQVRVQAVPALADVLEITMEGPAPPNGEDPGLKLRQRLRDLGGRARTRLTSRSLRIQVSFPPSAPDIES